MNGFIVIDKPAGITSHDVVSRVRRYLGTRKAGHTGTLDPFATGVLPVAVNSGTKVIPFLDEGTKTYLALLRLGVVTDTLDMTGAILSESDFSAVTAEQFVACLADFTGSITQIPPMYSALKLHGQPLYKLARQGIEIERKARCVDIYSLEMLSFDPPYASISVECSRGTYIRSLADDIGKTLGCGASLEELRRTASGPFNLKNAVTLDTLAGLAETGGTGEVLLPSSSALEHLIEIPLTEEGLHGLRFGRAPSLSAVSLNNVPIHHAGSFVRLTAEGKLAAIAQLVAGDTGTAIVLKRVLI